MNGTGIAAALLAGAVLAVPSVPRVRLRISRRHRVKLPVPLAGAAAVSVALTAAGPAAVLCGLIVSAVIAVRVSRLRRRRFRRQEGDALAAALDILAGELTVGAHPVAALGAAGSECGGTVGRSLSAVAARARLGADVPAGIRTEAAGSAIPGSWDRLAVFWQLAAEHGLAMSVLMRAAHRDIVERQRFADRMHAVLAGARATAGILAALPVLGVLLGQLIGAHPVRFLFGGGPGGLLLVIGVTLICAGVVWADRIVERLAP